MRRSSFCSLKERPASQLGFAAALDDGLKPGSVMLPERVISTTGESYRSAPNGIIV
jgi:hypothetical protein